ncbi:MAG: type II secretion system protein [Candidatus Riflebacteria bacterium]|nr:type II secretion system protein [Candidatus Riflebacteria bacterium]
MGSRRIFRAGVALLMVVGFVLALAISLTIAVPRARTAVAEAKEADLRFCLGEFRRAVERFRDCNGREPCSFDEMLTDAKGRRHLRRIYIDPFTGHSDWSFDIGTATVVIHSISSHTSLAGIPVSEFR